MSVVNTETVVMMGAALAAAGNVQGQEAVRTGERTIGWNEAKDVAARIQETARLRAELKAQCPDNMNEAVGKVFAGYGVDQLKDVKATLKSDGDKLNYMIDGNRFELDGNFGGGQMPGRPGDNGSADGEEIGEVTLPDNGSGQDGAQTLPEQPSGAGQGGQAGQMGQENGQTPPDLPSGGFDGKPLNTEIFGRDGSRVQNSQGETRSSTVLYDADGNMAAYVQKDERTGNVAGEFRGDDAVFRVEQAAGRVKAQITDRDSQMTMNVNGNRMSMQMESEELGVLKGSTRVGLNGTVHAKASLDERDGGEGVYSTASAKISRNGNMKMSVKSVDEEGILEDTALKVGKDGYSLKGVDDGEKVDESGKELNAAMFKKALENRGRF